MKIHKFKPTKKKDTLLFKLLLLVAGLHAAALLILGGMVISEIILQPEAAFEAPPPQEPPEKKKQIQHKVQQQQQSSNKLIKRIQIPQAKMNNVSTANIALPSSDIAGTSLSGGLAPKGFGDLKITMTSVNLLGLGGKTEKIVILLDTSRYMMTDARGALSTYNVIKADITKLVNSLPPTILFNVIAYAMPEKGGINISAFSQAGLVTASQDNKDKFFAWLDPINATLSKLEVKNNYKSKMPFLPQAPAAVKTKGGYNPEAGRLYRAYHAAMEQGADTIYILTAKWTPPGVVKRAWTQEDKDEYARDLEKAKKAHAAKLAAWNNKKDDKKEAQAEAKASIRASMTEEQKIAAAEKAKAEQAEKAKANAAKAKAIAEAKAKNAKAEADARAKAKAWIVAENARRKKNNISLFTGTVDQVMKQQGFKANAVNVPKKGGGGGGNPPPKFTPPPMDANKGYTASAMVKYYVSQLKKQNDSNSVSEPTVNMIIFKGVGENITAVSELAEAFCKAHNNGKIRVLEGMKFNNN